MSTLQSLFSPPQHNNHGGEGAASSGKNTTKTLAESFDKFYDILSSDRIKSPPIIKKVVDQRDVESATKAAKIDEEFNKLHKAIVLDKPSPSHRLISGQMSSLEAIEGSANWGAESHMMSPGSSSQYSLSPNRYNNIASSISGVINSESRFNDLYGMVNSQRQFQSPIRLIQNDIQENNNNNDDNNLRSGGKNSNSKRRFSGSLKEVLSSPSIEKEDLGYNNLDFGADSNSSMIDGSSVNSSISMEANSITNRKSSSDKARMSRSRAGSLTPTLVASSQPLVSSVSRSPVSAGAVSKDKVSNGVISSGGTPTERAAVSPLRVNKSNNSTANSAERRLGGVRSTLASPRGALSRVPIESPSIERINSSSNNNNENNNNNKSPVHDLITRSNRPISGKTDVDSTIENNASKVDKSSNARRVVAASSLFSRLFSPSKSSSSVSSTSSARSTSQPVAYNTNRNLRQAISPLTKHKNDESSNDNIQTLIGNDDNNSNVVVDNSDSGSQISSKPSRGRIAAGASSFVMAAIASSKTKSPSPEPSKLPGRSAIGRSRARYLDYDNNNDVEESEPLDSDFNGGDSSDNSSAKAVSPLPTKRRGRPPKGHLASPTSPSRSVNSLSSISISSLSNASSKVSNAVTVAGTATATVDSLGWTPIESTALYTCYCATPLQSNSGVSFWDEVSSRMLTKGIKRSADECQAKWFQKLKEAQVSTAKRKTGGGGNNGSNNVDEADDSGEAVNEKGDAVEEYLQSTETGSASKKRKKLNNNDFKRMAGELHRSAKEDDLFDSHSVVVPPKLSEVALSGSGLSPATRRNGGANFALANDLHLLQSPVDKSSNRDTNGDEMDEESDSERGKKAEYWKNGYVNNFKKRVSAISQKQSSALSSLFESGGGNVGSAAITYKKKPLKATDSTGTASISPTSKRVVVSKVNNDNDESEEDYNGGSDIESVGSGDI